MTLRKITLGRRARSHSLLVAGTSRRVMKTKRSPRHLADALGRAPPRPRWGVAASSRSSLRSRSARSWARVLSLRSARRWPMPTASCKSLWKPGAKPVSPLVDCVLQIAQPDGRGTVAVRRACPALRRVTVSDPDLGLGLALEEIIEHRSTATVDDQMVDGGRRQQHPLPPVMALDPGRGLVRGHHRAGANFQLAIVAGGWRSAGFARGRSDWRSPLRSMRMPNTSSSSCANRSKLIAWVTCRCRISAVRSGPRREPGGMPAGGDALNPRRQCGQGAAMPVNAGERRPDLRQL